jgi:hypothetical protein
VLLKFHRVDIFLRCPSPVVYSAENLRENTMFTYEWLGMPTESGIPRVLGRSMTSEANLTAAIARAKELLKSPIALSAGEPYGIRVLNNDSVLVWTGNVGDD